MQLTTEANAAIARQLYDAMRSMQTIAPLTESHPSITIEDAYHISREILRLRLSLDHEQLVGKKIGVTSAAVQEMLGVFQPDFGFLTDKMACANGADIPVGGQLIQPRAEGEIAFRLHSDLRGPGITEANVLAATATIIPCFEIVDSRIDDWRIAIQDTVADNASCGVFVLGDQELDPTGIDLAALDMCVYKNEKLISRGQGSAVQGNPLAAVAWLANTLGAFDIPLLAGEIILSGSLVPLAPVVAGDKMHLTLSSAGVQIGSASCNFIE
jgi:2-oxopent-4-enoate/cis-2-oxohex-4-enoate hydratase